MLFKNFPQVGAFGFIKNKRIKCLRSVLTFFKGLSCGYFPKL